MLWRIKYILSRNWRHRTFGKIKWEFCSTLLQRLKFDNFLGIIFSDITTENAINLLQDHPRLVLVTLVLVTGRIYIGQRYWTYWSKRGVSGPAPGLMEYGNFGAFMQLLESKSEPLTDKYGGQFGFYIGRTPFLFVSDVCKFLTFPSSAQRVVKTNNL